MRIKRIVIEFEPLISNGLVAGEEVDHAKTAIFHDGKWHLDGPIFSRYAEALHSIWTLIRDA